MKSKNRDSESFPAKCSDCICGIENGRGIWCVRLKKIPTPWEVKRCRKFCPKVILDNVIEQYK